MKKWMRGFAFSWFTCFAQGAFSVWPLPAKVSTGDDVLFIQDNVQISIHADSGSSAGNRKVDPASHTIIQTAIDVTHTTIFNHNFVPWKFHPRNSDFEPKPGGTTISSITLDLNGTSKATQDILGPLDGSVDESYSLEVTTDGQVTITAPTAVGISYGLNTFSQLFYCHSQGGAYMTSAPVRIDDKPAFVHRGLNMDVARQYYAPHHIKRTIDALAFNKFNRLHLHVTDGQSWPLEVPALRDLSNLGAFTPFQVYTPDQIKSLQKYAASRAVELYLEIDMPGHTSSIAFSHPELIAAFNKQPDWDSFCAEPPCGTLQLNNPDVYNFLDTLFGDVLPRVSPYSSYFHTGGDEVNFNAYTLDPTVKSNDSSVLQPLLQRFFDYIHQDIMYAGMTHVVWEEMLIKYNLSIPDEVVIQAWQSEKGVQQIVQSGHKVIAGNFDYWYLDCGRGQWVNFEIGPQSEKYFPFQDYCSPLKNWRLMYSYDPLSGVAPEDANMVLGAEASIWSEQTDGVSIDGVIWPRLAAAGEVLWSGAKDPETGQNRSQIAAVPRLSEMRERLVARGVAAATIQMPFCTQNGTQCTLPG